MLFDRVVAVDWSASATPNRGADSIWIADRRSGQRTELSNPATRSAAERELLDIIDGPERTLIGVDASLGYPDGSASHLGLSGYPPWRSMWSAVAGLAVDDERNRNNRFEVAATLNRGGQAAEGPFWGCPTDALAPALRRTKPGAFEVPEYRSVEELLRSKGHYPKSGWQLFGAGSVGGQTLTLLPILQRVLDRVDVWPFETGLRVPEADARNVVVEIWPSWFVRDIPAGMIVDAAQVAGTVDAVWEADEVGELSNWFEPRVDDAEAIEREEGWILGVR